MISMGIAHRAKLAKLFHKYQKLKKVSFWLTNLNSNSLTTKSLENVENSRVGIPTGSIITF